MYIIYYTHTYIYTYTGRTHTHTHLFYLIMFLLAFGAKEKPIMSMVHVRSGKWLKALFLEALSGLFHNCILPVSYSYDNKLPQRSNLKTEYFFLSQF